jgi:hypothetical protein
MEWKHQKPQKNVTKWAEKSAKKEDIGKNVTFSPRSR